MNGIPPDVAALAAAGVMEEHEPGVYRKPRMPRSERPHQDAMKSSAPDHPTEEPP